MDLDIENEILDGLDDTVNSNAFMIELGIPEGNHDLGEILVQHLQTGNFHHQLVKQDMVRDWYHYSERVFSRKEKNLICTIPKPGNTWNGLKNIKYEKISRDNVFNLLHDMLTGSQKYFLLGSHVRLISEKDSHNLIRNFFKTLDKEYSAWESYRIEANFLNTINEYYSSGYIKLGYFENNGRDLALVFKMEDSMYILLTNGYG